MILQFYFKESYSVLKIHVVVKLGCGNSSNMHESPVVASCSKEGYSLVCKGEAMDSCSGNPSALQFCE